MEILSLLTIIAYVLVPSLQVSLAIDSLSLSHSITDGMTIVSKNETFELGFFSPGTSKKRYVGIWYKNIPVQTVVWVANRVSPINDSSGILTVNSTGNLVLTHNNIVVWYTTSEKQAGNPVAQLLDSGNLVVREENEENPESYLWQSFDYPGNLVLTHNNIVVWYTTSEKQAGNPVAQLLDSGNLVVREENEENAESYLWQSFDYPSDTFLPRMKFGCDLRIGLNRNFTSWKSPDDPAPGDFSASIRLTGYPEFYMMKGSEKHFRSGPWNGFHLSGMPLLVTNPLYDVKFISNKDEVYYTYYPMNKSVITRSVLNQNTYVHQRYVWIEAERIWKTYTTMPAHYCDNYGLCGVYGTCILADFTVCKCLKGFKPKSPQAWNSFDWSQGCVRNKPLSCMNNSKDGFIKFEGLKLPETTHTLVDEIIGLEECKIKCLNNCSCMAYTNSDIRGTGSGCAMWFGDLIDVRGFSTGGQDLYIRMAASELENGHEKKLTIIVATIISAISGMLLFGSYYIYKARGNMTVKSKNIAVDQNNDEEDLDLPLFDLSTVATATDNFSNMNKIGEGGFGPVYKGKLVLGREIAVKRLSKSSRQGMIEFKNEVKLIAKLQHRNLVKLLGCCIQGKEKMLVYEYMPNTSLDCFIFDYTRGKLLDWPKRFNIICGIARGLLYLHQDSRLRIIHRDLKASNVLLDDKLDPKISDFGIARIFEGDQIEENTNKIIGTFGYMAPEYVANGLFSVKSDVFSFGILLLEMICGKRNRGFYHPDDTLNLIGHAWKLWKDDRALELVDTNMKDSCIVSEVLRCIHVSLLCVQQFPEDRPTMSSVVPMLGGENELVEPKLPGFFPRKDSAEANSSPIQKETSLINEITITLFEAR